MSCMWPMILNNLCCPLFTTQTYYIIILGGWGQGHDDLDNAREGVQNWAEIDYVICARSMNTSELTKLCVLEYVLQNSYKRYGAY